MWLAGRDLTLPCFRQTKDAFAFVLSRPDVDPTLLAQQGQSASKGCTVHGNACTQRLLIRLADDAEGGQQTKLSNFDVGLSEFLVVNASDQSCEATKVLTSTCERKEAVRSIAVRKRCAHNSMYIHLILFCVKKRERGAADSGRLADQPKK